MEGAHLLPMVIRNIKSDPHFYEKATLPFPVNESDNLFVHYKREGYEFDDPDKAATSDKLPSASLPGYLDFFRQMGRAKHEPCGEHWTVAYGESAWRMAVMALCLPRDGIDRGRLVRQSLASAFTGMGQSTDHCSEWPEKIKEVRSLLCKHLPGQVSLRLFEYYSSHASCRRGLDLNSREAKVYRKLVEFEEALLQWEEIRVSTSSSQFRVKVCFILDLFFRKRARLRRCRPW